MPPAVDTINALEQGNAVERETLEKLKEGAVTLLDGLITSGVLLFKSSRSPLKSCPRICFGAGQSLCTSHTDVRKAPGRLRSSWREAQSTPSKK
ncbi:hypothetical protein DPSP01_002995 [Paraphaeosphaeria sporulosa]